MARLFPADIDATSSGAPLEAATVLRGLPEVCLVERDMLDHARELAAQGRTFDLIHSSFAMHHLSSADKAHLFRAM